MLKKVIDDKGVIFSKDNFPKELIEILNTKKVVVLGEYRHYSQEHQEFLSGLVKELHQFGFHQVLQELLHAHSWLAEDYVIGEIDSLPEVIKYFDFEYLEQIRNFNKDLPENERVIVKYVDMNHWEEAFIDSIKLMESVVDTHGLFDDLKDLDPKSDKYYEELTNLKSNLQTYRKKLTDKWYERMEEMIEVEMKSFKLRAVEYDPALREEIIIDLCKKHLSEKNLSILNFGSDHARKKRLDEPDEDYQLLGEFITENYNSYHIGFIGIKGEIKHTFRDLEIVKFNLLKEEKEGKLFRIIGEKQGNSNMFLPLDGPVFKDEFKEFDAYISYPEISVVKSMEKFKL